MKKLSTLLVFLILTVFTFSQNVYRWYQDGKIVFQLKASEKVIFSDENKEVQLSQFPEIAQYKNTYGIDRIIQLHPGIQDNKLVRTYQIEFTGHQNVDVLVRKLNQLNTFEYVEKKELHETFLTPNDPNFVNQTNNGQWSLFQINAQQAWDISTGSSNIVVAVTDNAIQVNHPDLQNKVVNGRDVVDNDNDPSPCGGNDGFHGSHVSGIVGAETNNSTGIASIGYNVSIMPIKIGNCSTGALSGGYDGIVWAADNNADVVNMSWGGGGQSTYGQNVCNYAWNAGTILVAAAGNDGTSQQFYPAAYNNVVSVASTTTNDAKSSFSQYGTWIDISAPGSSILSCNESTGYQVTQGTSMASPLVAGLVGLMKSHAPSASNQDIVDCLLNSADNIDAQNGSYIGQLGSGRINAEQALVCMNQYTYSLDIGIAQINAPDGQICSGSVTPEFVLKNYGATTVTSATITYEISGQGQQTLNWTGNLAQGDDEVITLPVQSPGAGSFTFDVTASQPNGNTDQNSSNNNNSSGFTTVTNGQIATLTLITDCYGSEVEWTIEDDNSGQTIASGGPYTDVAGGQTITEDFCLAAGCYTFEITDSYGDGMYGSQWNCSVDGDYDMVDNNGTLFEMTASNGDYGNGTSHNFCIASNTALDAGISQIISPGGGICTSSFTPEVQLYNFGTSALTSVTINYEVSGGATQTYNWSGNLAPGTYTTVALPAVSVPPGSYTFTAATSMPNGSTDQQPVNDDEDAAFAVFASSQALPFSEDFESANFSNNNWTMQNPDGGITWEIATIAGTTPGDKAAKLDFYNYGNGGERDIMQTPPLDFSTHTDIELSFDHAFRRYNTSSADSLIILLSTDCGATFQSLARYAEDGTGSFATATTNTNEFTPVAGEWCMGSVGANCFTLDLSAYDGFTNVIIRFESFNNGIAGNNLFIDNINIEGVPNTSPPSASIGSSTQTTCVGDNVVFSDNSSGGPNSWTWDFGDGNTSTQQNPTHTYTTPGIYDVSLTASNPNGTDTETLNGYIVVYDNTGSSQTVEICDGESVSVGSSTYTSAGTYTNVLLNANGCDSTVTTTVVVNPSPAPTISAESTTICSNTSTLTLNGNPSGGTFAGTGMNGNVFDPSQAGIGTHTITYSVTNGSGCTGTEAIQMTVENCLSINENGDSNITLFPNPNNGQFRINGLEPGTQFTIFNIQGQVITSGSSNANHLDIQLPKVEDGVYMIQLTNDNTSVIRRFVVKD